MSIKTKIQWCDSTVNPTLGCDGCELWKRGVVEICYAGKMTNRFGPSNPGLANIFEHVEVAPGRLAQAAGWSDLAGRPRWDKPWLHDLPRLIFVSDMADSFSAEITFDYLKDEVIEVIASEEGQYHHWLWLTKRPGRMAKFTAWLAKRGITWPANLWAGTSVTTQATLTRVDQLFDVGDETTLRFVSVEPQWEEIDFGDRLNRLDWVIQGGESGTVKHAFDLAWADSLRVACHRARTPYFLKQLGTHIVVDGERVKLKDKTGGTRSEWPERLRVREMPIYRGRKPSDKLRRRDGGTGQIRCTARLHQPFADRACWT